VKSKTTRLPFASTPAFIFSRLAGTVMARQPLKNSRNFINVAKAYEQQGTIHDSQAYVMLPG
jgi:hypothetical protein